MSVVSRVLISSKYANSAQTTTEYTAPASTRTIIDKLTITNITAGDLEITVYLVPNGSAAGNSNLIYKKDVVANTTADLTDIKGHTLDTGDFISILGEAANSLVIRASGREVSS